MKTERESPCKTDFKNKVTNLIDCKNNYNKINKSDDKDDNNDDANDKKKYNN